jgi:hypothetical protein
VVPDPLGFTTLPWLQARCLELDDSTIGGRRGSRDGSGTVIKEEGWGVDWFSTKRVTRLGEDKGGGLRMTVSVRSMQ